MMRVTRLRRALRGKHCKQALRGGRSAFTTAESGVPPPSPPASSSSSSSSRNSGAAGELAASKGAAKESAVAGRVVTPRRSEWRPSEAHRESATSVARNQNAHLKAGTAPRTAAPTAARDGTSKAKSAGLRRRELLGGGEYVPSQAQIAAASGAPSPASSMSKSRATAAAAAAAAGESWAPSVVSLSATNRFRARQALERLAAAGDAEAIEALRASTPPSASPSQIGGTTGGSSAGGGGFTPATVLPLLLALVGAGYCVVNDLVPREWLSWIGNGGRGSGGGGGGGGGDGPGDSSPASGTRAGDESTLSPLLRTLSGVAAFVPMASSSDKKTTTEGGRVGPETEATSTDGARTDGDAEPRRDDHGREGEGGWRLWGWWGRGRTQDGDTPSPAGSADEERENVTLLRGGDKDLDADRVSLSVVTAAEEGPRRMGERGGAPVSERQQRPPRWLWGAPPPASAPSGSP